MKWFFFFVVWLSALIVSCDIEGSLSVNAAGGAMTIAIRNLNLLWCNACSAERYVELLGSRRELFTIQVNNYLGLNGLTWYL
jgi:hypothetical protein